MDPGDCRFHRIKWRLLSISKPKLKIKRRVKNMPPSRYLHLECLEEKEAFAPLSLKELLRHFK